MREDNAVVGEKGRVVDLIAGGQEQKEERKGRDAVETRVQACLPNFKHSHKAGTNTGITISLPKFKH